MNTVTVELAYAPGTQAHKDAALGPEDIVVAHFRTPKVLPNGGAGGWVSAYEHKAERWNRAMCISTKPGDFSKNSITYDKANGRPRTVCTNYVEDFEPTIRFNSNPASGGYNLLADTDYYVNMKTLSASEEDCDVQISLSAAKTG